MYLIAFCGSNKFCLEKIIFLNNLYVLFYFIPNDNFINNKIIFSFLKLFSLKNNVLTFQFRNFYFYNNLVFYNNYIFFNFFFFEKIFLFLSDFGLFFSKNFFNFIFFILNFHISLLPFYKGSNPVLGLNYFFNKFIGYTVFLINKKIDKGNNYYFCKLFKKYNYNYNIIKYIFFLNFSIKLKNIFIKIFFNFLYFYNQLFYSFFFNLTK